MKCDNFIKILWNVLALIAFYISRFVKTLVPIPLAGMVTIRNFVLCMSKGLKSIPHAYSLLDVVDEHLRLQAVRVDGAEESCTHLRRHSDVYCDVHSPRRSPEVKLRTQNQKTV